ncbi:DNA polymerase subunit Cdc27 [Pyronema omphalodes]|nr:DNA polymerase subunit Cdc27 [Pyronema omphalodes]
MSYTDYLNAEIAERKIITYRTLSRQQQKHVNVAKQMLWEFYESANKKEPGSIHATYLITGYRERRVEETVDEGGDTIMDASPPSGQGASGEMKAIVVCPEEKLQETKKSFVRISSIHIYSVEPNKIKDINIIVGACEEFLKTHLHNSYDDRQKGLYGTIRNKEAKPHAGRAPVVQAARSKPAVAAPAPKTVPKATSTPAPSSAKTKQASAASMFAKKPAVAKKQDSQPSESEPEPAKKPAAKKGSQQAFFSNWKSLEKKTAKLEITPEAEPEAMKIDTDSEGDDEAELEPPKQDIAEESRKRMVKQQELEAMMESDDDEQPPPKKKMASPSPSPQKEEKPEPVKEEPRRRRGKRKVTKKVTTKDEEGYLVTKTETTWESYSEDETAPPPPASKPKAAPAKAVKKPTGQGNIMSFFQKK